jgi:D-beta-D-heptose 7-phosphate kinase/D-beta-D-heptose 1-phosphate adenosyltransferase
MVLGDYIRDVYITGRCERLCPEAPVPVLVPEDEHESDGGAGLVFNQLRELGANVKSFYFSRSAKTRYFSGGHLLMRVDNDSYEVNPPTSIEGWFDDVDAFVVADYGKGAMTEELAQQIVDTGKPLFVDAKHHWEWYAGPNTIAFPNEHETVSAYDYVRVVQKLGAKGAIQIDEEAITKLSATVSEVVDVTGAGDCFIAAYVYAWTLQLPKEHCLIFANEPGRTRP